MLAHGHVAEFYSYNTKKTRELHLPREKFKYTYYNIWQVVLVI